MVRGDVGDDVFVFFCLARELGVLTNETGIN
jgi:hypothetical protein